MQVKNSELQAKNSELQAKDSELHVKKGEIQQLTEHLKQKEGFIDLITHSRSWKLTKPLRMITELLHGEVKKHHEATVANRHEDFSGSILGSSFPDLQIG